MFVTLFYVWYFFYCFTGPQILHKAIFTQSINNSELCYSDCEFRPYLHENKQLIVNLKFQRFLQSLNSGFMNKIFFYMTLHDSV